MPNPSPSALPLSQALKRFDVFDMLTGESKEACIRNMRQKSFRAGDVVVETWGGSEERRLCLPVRSRTLSNMTEAVYRNLGVGGGAR